jgi:SAM-dependent methyltransferase
MANPQRYFGDSTKQRKSVYDAPELYRLAFSYRNVAVESAALIRWFKKIRGERKPPVSVLELAAGPAHHAIELARKGINATALDLSPTMCKFARRHAREQSVSLKVVKGDMISFSLKKEYDLAITMLDSINQIHKLNDMVKHLRSVADCLVDDGIYIIELAKHEKKGEQLEDAKWKITRNNKELRVHWRPLAERSNGKSYKLSLELVAKDERGLSRLTDVMHLRTWSPKEIERAVSRAGCFKIAAKYGDFRKDMRATDRDAWSYIFVLRKLKTK